jgi:hypothetical protein
MLRAVIPERPIRGNGALAGFVLALGRFVHDGLQSETNCKKPAKGKGLSPWSAMEIQGEKPLPSERRFFQEKIFSTALHGPPCWIAFDLG